MQRVGHTVSHYRIEERLGSGAMGAVYRATDVRLGRPVALKFLLAEDADEVERARFITEARAASALDHPNIVTIYDVGETESGELYIAMAYHAGETLKERIRRGPLTLEDALEIAMQLADGLSKAHAHGIVHRDVKPANVIVTPDGIAKLVDFGLAKLSGVRITRTGTTLGTTAYMPPETLVGEGADARADLWSLGVVLYEMITGRLPFQAETIAAMAHAIQTAAPRPIPELRSGVPAAVRMVVEKALVKEVRSRYPSADAMLLDLRTARRELHSDGGVESAPTIVRGRLLESRTAAESSPSGAGGAWRRRLTRIALAGALLGVLAAAGWLGVLLFEGEPSEIVSLDARRRFEQARDYEERGDTRFNLESAESLYRTALEVEPGNPLVEAHLAYLLTKLEVRFPERHLAEESETLARHALSQRSDLAAAHAALGRLALMRGDVEEAKRLAAAAKSADPQDYRGYTLLGDALFEAGAVEAGLAELRAGVDVGRGHIWARAALAERLLDIGRRNQAAAEYERILEYVPDSPKALNNLATIYMMEGNFLGSVPLYRRLLSVQPDDTAAANLGIALYYLGRIDDAIVAFADAQQRAPDQPVHRFNLAEAYERKGDEERARNWYRLALEAFDRRLEQEQSAAVAAQRALCLARLGRGTEAAATARRLAKANDGDAEVLFFGAQTLATLGEREGALELLSRALAHGYPAQLARRSSPFDTWEEDDPSVVELFLGNPPDPP